MVYSIIVLPFLWTFVSAAQSKTSRPGLRRDLEVRDRYTSKQASHVGLIERTDSPGTSQGQWLVFVEVTPSSTGVPTPTAFNHANKGVAKEDLAVQADQKGAQSYVQAATTQIRSTPTSPVASESSGPVALLEVREWLEAHNVARRKHGAGELKWSDDLAVGAKSNAIQCKGEHT